MDDRTQDKLTPAIPQSPNNANEQKTISLRKRVCTLGRESLQRQISLSGTTWQMSRGHWAYLEIASQIIKEEI